MKHTYATNEVTYISMLIMASAVNKKLSGPVDWSFVCMWLVISF